MHFYIDPILLLWLRNKIPLSENITQLFQDKIEKANHILKTVGLPRQA